jgi:hypothetical protein
VNLRLQKRVAGGIEFQPDLKWDDDDPCARYDPRPRALRGGGMAVEQHSVHSRESAACVAGHLNVMCRAQGAPQPQHVYRGMSPSSIESALAASREGHFAIAHLLLECGADVDAADE